MTDLENKIIDLLINKPGLYDREITNILLGKGAPQQRVNQACRALESKRAIIRQIRKDGLIGNYPTKTIFNPQQIINQPKRTYNKNNHSKTKQINSKYNREDDLKDRFNKFISRITNQENDYFSQLSIEDYLYLKITLKDINNIITLKASYEFINWLCYQFKFDENEKNILLNQLKSTKPSSNGFDIRIEKPCKIIAEVKCNIPINFSSKFGSKQREGIERDIESLAYGKDKVKGIEVNEYYKFLSIYEVNENIKNAVIDLIKSLKKDIKEKVELFQEDSKFNTKKVYIVILKYTQSNLI